MDTYFEHFFELRDSDEGTVDDEFRTIFFTMSQSASALYSKAVQLGYAEKEAGLLAYGLAGAMEIIKRYEFFKQENP